MDGGEEDLAGNGEDGNGEVRESTSALPGGSLLLGSIRRRDILQRSVVIRSAK